VSWHIATYGSAFIPNWEKFVADEEPEDPNRKPLSPGKLPATTSIRRFWGLELELSAKYICLSLAANSSLVSVGTVL
jgi:hypothetical protein